MYEEIGDEQVIPSGWPFGCSSGGGDGLLGRLLVNDSLLNTALSVSEDMVTMQSTWTKRK